MARFIDLLNRRSRGHFRKGMSAVTQILVADTIIQEIQDDPRSKELLFTAGDFPRAAPPFKSVWIEGKLPRDTWAGMTVHAWDAAEVGTEVLKLGKVKRHDVRWVLGIYPIFGREKGADLDIIIIAGQLQYVYLNEEGYAISGLTAPVLRATPDVEAMMRGMMRVPQPPVVAQSNMAASVLQIFALMNCVNVKPVTIAPPPALSKSHEKKYRVPMSTYKVLTVQGANISQRIGTGKGGKHSPPRRHIVRGHFKHLKSGKTAWWQPHVRGRDEDGSIRKRYQVLKPEGANGPGT